MKLREKLSKSVRVRKCDDLILEDIFNHIHSDIIPKYDDLVDCHMYQLPQEINADYEYIFKLKHPLLKPELETLTANIYEDISDYCDKINEPYFILNILIILSEI